MRPARRSQPRLPRLPRLFSAVLAVLLGAGTVALSGPTASGGSTTGPALDGRAAHAVTQAAPAAPGSSPAAARTAGRPTVRGAGTQRPIGPDPAVDLLAHGNLTMASNSVLTCDPSDGTVCSDTEGSNNGRTMFVKTDPTAPGANASSAQLLMPAGATVLSARLYWQFNPTGTSTNGTSGDINKGNQVSWKVPGASGYQQLTADTYDWFDQKVGGTPPEPLLAAGAVKDVTDLVKAAGAGSYTVADIQACSGRSSAQNFGGNNVGCWGGWSLVVAYEAPAEPLRYLQVWDGYQLLRDPDNLTTLTLAGIRTPATTAPKATMGVTVGDGDAPIAGDQLFVGPDVAGLTPLIMPGPTGPGTDNAFTSRIDQVAIDGSAANITTRAPAPINNYGYDARMIDVTGKIPAGSTQALLRINGAGDALEPQAVWFAVDALEPDLQITKANTPAGTTDDTPPGLIRPGGTISYAFTVTNQHQDGSTTDLDTATAITVTDQLPAGTTFKAGSNPNCTAAGRTVTCSLADLAPGASGTVTFQVTVDADTTAGTKLDDTATLGFKGIQTQRSQTRTSNTVRNTVTDVPAYSIAKTATPANAAPGDTVHYRIQVTNTGRLPAPGVTLADDLAGVLDDAAYNNDAAADLGTVRYAGGVLHWTGDLAVGAAASITYSVTVGSPDSGDRTLRNTVSSDTFDNNCRPASSDEHCRADVPITVPTPSPTPSPTQSPSPTLTPAPTPSSSSSLSPGPTPDHGGRLPDTGSGALPLLALAALAALTAGAFLLTRTRRRRH